MVVAVFLLMVTHYTGLLKMPEIVSNTAKALIPLIAINVLGLGVNTLCLVYVDTSFYQVTLLSTLLLWVELVFVAVILVVVCAHPPIIIHLEPDPSIDKYSADNNNNDKDRQKYRSNPTVSA